MKHPKKTLLTSLALVSSVILSMQATADETTRPLIKNGETPEVSVSGETTVYTYSDLVVTTEKGTEGDRIVFQLAGNDGSFEFCAKDMSAYYYGYNGSIAFLVDRSGWFPRVTGFNLKEMDMDPYDELMIREGGIEVDGSKLIFWRIMEYPSPAAEAAAQKKAEKLEDEDLQVFYVQKEIYDYATKENTKLETYDCVGIEY